MHIHGNKEALESIINDIKNENISEVICLGDVIGLGPNSSECLDLIINNNIKMILGNHELYAVYGTEIDDEMSERVKKHHHWVDKQIKGYQRDFLSKCNLSMYKEFHSKKILFEHFLMNFNPNNSYPFYDFDIIDNGSIKDIVKTLDYDLIFIGHEHKDFSIDNKLYDVGSSGCRSDNYTKYTILDTDSFIIDTKTISYDRKSFENNVLENDYPDREYIVKKFFNITC